MNIKFDDKDLKAAMKKLEQKLEHAKPINEKIGQILVNGFVAQHEDAGSHWGEKWEKAGPQITRIRKWQGYNYDPNVPGTATGNTKKSYSYSADDKGVVAGNILKSAREFEEGSNSLVIAEFRKKGGSGETKKGYFKGVPKRRILPGKLTSKEESAIHTAIKKEVIDGI